MAGELLDHVGDLLDGHRATADQLRFALARVSEALRDVKRIADSRGARLPQPDGEDADVMDTDDDDGGPRLTAGAFG